MRRFEIIAVGTGLTRTDWGRRCVGAAPVVATVIVMLCLLSGTASACYEYVAQTPTCNVGAVPTPINNPGDYDMQVESYSASCNAQSGALECAVSCALRVFDDLPLNSDENAGGGSVEPEATLTWVWNGPPGTAPGATYDCLYNGDGNMRGQGTANASGFCINGQDASSSGKATSRGSVSTTGVPRRWQSWRTVEGSVRCL